MLWLCKEASCVYSHHLDKKSVYYFLDTYISFPSCFQIKKKLSAFIIPKIHKYFSFVSKKSEVFRGFVPCILQSLWSLFPCVTWGHYFTPSSSHTFADSLFQQPDWIIHFSTADGKVPLLCRGGSLSWFCFQWHIVLIVGPQYCFLSSCSLQRDRETERWVQRLIQEFPAGDRPVGEWGRPDRAAGGANCDAVLMEASADPLGELWSWTGPSELPNLRWRSWASVSYCPMDILLGGGIILGKAAPCCPLLPRAISNEGHHSKQPSAGCIRLVRCLLYQYLIGGMRRHSS